MLLYSTTYQSPIGLLHIKCNDNGITSALFVAEDLEASRDVHPLLASCIQQLDAYFAGQLQIFNLPLEQTGTEFQQRTWQLLQGIPFGKTISYMQMAKQYGDVKAIRALASANGKNKISIIVPCHRVIGTDQSLTGYAGGLWRKRWLLEHEARGSGGLQTLF